MISFRGELSNLWSQVHVFITSQVHVYISFTGDLYHSPLIYKHLITAYVPFLPLEEVHVRMCIKDHLIENKYYEYRDEIPDYQIQRISYELQYYPSDTRRFSVTGCKRIPEKVAYVMDDDE